MPTNVRKGVGFLVMLILMGGFVCPGEHGVPIFS